MSTANNNTTTVKKYDLMAIYDPRCTNIVKATVEEKKVPTKIVADTYLYIKDLTAEQVESYKTILSECSLKSSDGTKTYKIRFSSYKCDAILPKVEKKVEPKERQLKGGKDRKLARLAKKAGTSKTAKAIAKAARMVHHKGSTPSTACAAKRNLRKKQGLTGRGSKNKYIDDKQGLTTVHYRRGTMESNLQKHIRQRAAKAGRYIIKQEQKKAVTMAVNKPKKANMKPVQKEMALAA